MTHFLTKLPWPCVQCLNKCNNEWSHAGINMALTSISHGILLKHHTNPYQTVLTIRREGVKREPKHLIVHFEKNHFIYSETSTNLPEVMGYNCQDKIFVKQVSSANKRVGIINIDQVNQRKCETSVFSRLKFLPKLSQHWQKMQSSYSQTTGFTTLSTGIHMTS
jgi:hypothetical protein